MGDHLIVAARDAVLNTRARSIAPYRGGLISHFSGPPLPISIT